MYCFDADVNDARVHNSATPGRLPDRCGGHRVRPSKAAGFTAIPAAVPAEDVHS